MNIGLYWSCAVLEHKLARTHQRGRVEEVWNVRRLPKGLGHAGRPDLLFIAVSKRWRGFFRLLPEILYTPEDPACPYALIFDAKSWTEFADRLPCSPFRGYTYTVPSQLIDVATTLLGDRRTRDSRRRES